MSNYGIERVVVEKGAGDHGMTAAILERTQGVPVKTIGNPGSDLTGEMADPDKRTLRLVDFPGEFLKPCPGTKNYICCGYWILNVGTNCPLDCTYCILQAYFNQPSLRVFVNLPEELAGVGDFLDTNRQRLFRIGTGEFTDSLALDAVTGWSDTLLPFMAQRKNAVLELKTKTDNVKALITSSYRDRIIVSWSLNASEISSREEKGAPTIRKRLEAARACQREGFLLGFHFDPMIHYPGWQEGYAGTVEMLDRFIDPKKVIWISLGGLRYIPGLKSIIRRRHAGTPILNGEFIQGLDGKMRYFKPIRMEMYSFMRSMLREWNPDLCIYLCMEGEEVWENALGWSPKGTEGLSRYLDQRVEGFLSH